MIFALLKLFTCDDAIYVFQSEPLRIQKSNKDIVINTGDTNMSYGYLDPFTGTVNMRYGYDMNSNLYYTPTEEEVKKAASKGVEIYDSGMINHINNHTSLAQETENVYYGENMAVNNKDIETNPSLSTVGDSSLNNTIDKKEANNSDNKNNTSKEKEKEDKESKNNKKEKKNKKEKEEDNCSFELIDNLIIYYSIITLLI